MLKVKEKVMSFWQNHDLEKFVPYDIKKTLIRTMYKIIMLTSLIWDKFFKIVILPKNGHFFFNFKHQLLHIFQWDGQNQDIPYDHLEEESHNI